MKEILQEDITVEIMSQKQLNTNIGVMLIYGYLLNMAVAFFFGDYLMNYRNIYDSSNDILFAEIVFCLITAVVCNLSVYFTSSIKIQLVLFHFAALVMTPITAVVYRGAGMIFGNMHSADYEWLNLNISGKVLAVFWGFVILFIFARWILSARWEGASLKLRYTLLMTFIFTTIVTVLAELTIGSWITGCIAGFIFSMHLGVSWFYACKNAQGCSRYYAIVSASRIMNIVGTAFSMGEKSNGGITFR